MKKILLVLMASVLAFGVQAQKLNIQNAIDAIKENDLEKAKDYINKATENESTKKDGTAWLVKAFIYQAIGTSQKDLVDPKTGEDLPFIANINGKTRTIDLGKANSLQPTTPDALEASISAFNRYIYYDRKHDKNLVATSLSSILLTNFNKAINAYNSSDYKKSLEYLDIVDQVVNIRKGTFYPSLGSDKLGEYFKAQAADVGAKSKKMMATASYYAGDKDKAMELLQENIKDESASSDNAYLMLANIYKEKGDNATYLSTIQSGLKKFPDSKGLKNEEMNHLITSGNAEQALTKLEEAIISDPKNPEYFFNAGVFYSDLAKAEKDGVKKHAYFDKAESRYKKAIELKKDNPDYQLNLGALYFNKSAEITERMNAEQDLKKYDIIKNERNNWLKKAMPVLEGARSALEAKGPKSEVDKNSYKQVLSGLSDIYARLDQLEKVIAIKAILKGME